VTKTRRGLAGARIQHIAKSNFQDTSTVIIIPSRDHRPIEERKDKTSEKWPWLRHEFVAALNAIMWPMNGRRHIITVTGEEVGRAYDDTVAEVLKHPELSKWKYLATIEDDTVPPPNAFLSLYESIELGPFDGVGALYFTKGDFNMPMCYGDPREFAATGALDFRPRDIAQALKEGEIMECNGIANGCSLFRMSAFKDIPRPWFQTLNKMGEGAMTQDLFWCRKAKLAGKRFAVDMRVTCSHVDWNTGVWY
jgi:hypothetical protein